MKTKRHAGEAILQIGIGQGVGATVAAAGRLLSAVLGGAILTVIRAYQWLLSPVLPASCRYAPGCSAYAAEAVGRFGPFVGGWMALKRILRCNPWAEGGYDPVPDHRADCGCAGVRAEGRRA